MTGSRRQQRLGVVLALVLVALVWYLQGSFSSEQPADPADVATVEVIDLPAEAQHTLALIDAGGPFPYPDNDGIVFGNREGLLPDQPSGYYHEYTVPTPGSEDRGARRIVTGGDAGDQAEYYWTDDHYRSFERIRR